MGWCIVLCMKSHNKSWLIVLIIFFAFITILASTTDTDTIVARILFLIMSGMMLFFLIAFLYNTYITYMYYKNNIDVHIAKLNLACNMSYDVLSLVNKYTSDIFSRIFRFKRIISFETWIENIYQIYSRRAYGR